VSTKEGAAAAPPAASADIPLINGSLHRLPVLVYYPNAEAGTGGGGWEERVTVLLICAAAVFLALVALAALIVPALREFRLTVGIAERALERTRRHADPAMAELHGLLETLHSLSGTVSPAGSRVRDFLDEVARSRENLRMLKKVTAIFALLGEVSRGPLSMRIIPILLQTTLTRKGG
jgi:hypothetical protein